LIRVDLKNLAKMLDGKRRLSKATVAMLMSLRDDK